MTFFCCLSDASLASDASRWMNSGGREGERERGREVGEGQGGRWTRGGGRGVLTRAAVEQQVSCVSGHTYVGHHFLDELVHHS